MVPSRYDSDGGWDEHKMLVLSQLKELRAANQELSIEMRESLQAIRDDIQGLRAENAEEMKGIAVDIGKLNVKAGLWGALAGAVLSTGILLSQMLGK